MRCGGLAPDTVLADIRIRLNRLNSSYRDEVRWCRSPSSHDDIVVRLTFAMAARLARPWRAGRLYVKNRASQSAARRLQYVQLMARALLRVLRARRITSYTAMLPSDLVVAIASALPLSIVAQRPFCRRWRSIGADLHDEPAWLPPQREAPISTTHVRTAFEKNLRLRSAALALYLAPQAVRCAHLNLPW